MKKFVDGDLWCIVRAVALILSVYPKRRELMSSLFLKDGWVLNLFLQESPAHRIWPFESISLYLQSEIVFNLSFN